MTNPIIIKRFFHPSFKISSIIKILFITTLSLTILLCAVQLKGTELITSSKLLDVFSLPNCRIYHIIQDQTGYLWIGTNCGLFRFDGYTFREYRNSIDTTNNISHNRVRTLLQDDRGVIWAGTHGGGLNRYDNKRDKFSPYASDSVNDALMLSDGRITSMVEDRLGQIWIGTYAGLNIINTERNEIKQIGELLGDENRFIDAAIASILADTNGTIWIANRENGLCRYIPDLNRLEPFELKGVTIAKQAGLGMIKTLFEDSANYLWVGTRTGDIYRIDPSRNQFQHLKVISSFKDMEFSIHCIKEDANKNILISTSDGMYNWQINTEGSLIDRHPKLANPSIIQGDIIHIFIDRYDQIWMGHANGGLSKIDAFELHRFFSLPLPKSIRGRDQFVTSLCEDALDTIWLTTNQNIENLWTLDTSKKKIESVSLTNLLPNNLENIHERKVLAVASGKGGKILLLVENGKILQFDPLYNKIVEKFSIDERYIAGRRHHFMMDSKDSLWLWVDRKLYGPFELSKDSMEMIERDFDKIDGFNNGRIANFSSPVVLVREGCNTGLWIAIGEGDIYRYNSSDDILYPFTIAPGIIGENKNITIFDIYEDSDGWLWIATDIGLFKLDAEKNQILDSYTKANGLASEVIKGVVQDNQGDFWVGTLVGISKIDQHAGKIFNFDSLESFFQHPVMRVSTGQALRSRSGNLFFTSLNGVVGFNPINLNPPERPPQIVIDNITCYEKYIPKFSENSISEAVNRKWKDGNEIEIPFHKNTVQISYTGIHYKEPRLNQYAVMLEGLDSGWQFVLSKRTATYAHLSPGNYVFRVKAANSHGVWNEAGTTLAFTILKPFWGTWWFALCVIGLTVIIVFGIIKLHVFRIEREKTILTKRVDERTRNLEESQKELILQEKLSSMAKINRLEKDITTISEQTRRHLGEALHDDLCPHLMGIEAQVSAIASQLTKLSLEQGPRAKEIRDSIQEGIRKARNISRIVAPIYSMEKGLQNALQELAVHVEQIFDVGCRLYIHGDVDILDHGMEVDLYLIVQEAVYNAIKHGKPDRIHIILLMGLDRLETLCVIDDGCGIANDQLSNGMGLRIMQFRARKLASTVTIKNGPLGGAMVELSLDDQLIETKI